MSENTTPERVKIINTAAELVVGDRQQDYGPPIINFERIAALWNTHMETDAFTPRKVAELMILLKVARTINSPTRDSYVDIAGYAGLGGEFAELEKVVEDENEA